MQRPFNKPVQFFPRDGGVPFTRDLQLTSAVFPPDDPWGVAFRQALARENFDGKVVVELGVGSGVAAVQVLLTSAPRAMVLSDLVPACVSLAAGNVAMVCGEHMTQARVELRVEEGDAVDCLRRLAAFCIRPDAVIGCLPQVPGSLADLGDPANAAHLYDPSRHWDFKHWGLGLIADAKAVARSILSPGGRMLLVHSGRVPRRVRQEMDDAIGFRETRIVHQAMVLHHVGTPLAYLFGEHGELLFGDPEGREVITPEEAEQRRLAFVEGRCAEGDYRVYHWVHVVESAPV